MKYLIIISGVFWACCLISFLFARFRSGAEEPIAATIGILVVGGAAVLSTVILGIVGLVKLIGR